MLCGFVPQRTSSQKEAGPIVVYQQDNLNGGIARSKRRRDVLSDGGGHGRRAESRAGGHAREAG